MISSAIASAARPNTLTKTELAIYDEARTLYKERERVPCTGCGYCQPCPAGVNIPEVFSMYNAASMFDTRKGTGSWYKASLVGDGHSADACVRCGECVPKCPQGIGIPDRLEEAHTYLTTV